MTLLMLFRFNLSGRLAALTLMNIGILSGLSIDNHSLPCVNHHLQLFDNLWSRSLLSFAPMVGHEPMIGSVPRVEIRYTGSSLSVVLLCGRRLNRRLN